VNPGLPDLNVLIAAAWPNHVHHRIARRWFAENAEKGWATCPFTQAGFVRLSSNPRMVKDAVSPPEALKLLCQIIAIGRHEFWPDDIDMTTDESVFHGTLVGHQQITDAYLLALALKHKGRLVTLDQSASDLLRLVSLPNDSIEILNPF
jgi:toxin-antitoxin system PIN domain toxin